MSMRHSPINSITLLTSFEGGRDQSTVEGYRLWSKLGYNRSTVDTVAIHRNQQSRHQSHSFLLIPFRYQLYLRDLNVRVTLLQCVRGVTFEKVMRMPCSEAQLLLVSFVPCRNFVVHV
jgi:hypothetical protein